MCDMVDNFQISVALTSQLQAQLNQSEMQLLQKQAQLQNMTDQIYQLNETLKSKNTKIQEQSLKIQDQQAEQNELTEKIKQLASENSTLEQQLKQKQIALSVELAKAPLLLERSPVAAASEGVLRTRAKGATGKYTTSVIVSVPHSRVAFQATLDKRVSDLRKV